MKCSHPHGIPGVDFAHCPDCQQTFLPKSQGWKLIQKRQLVIPGIDPEPEFEAYPVKFLNLSRGKDVPWEGTAIAQRNGYLTVRYESNGGEMISDIPPARILPDEPTPAAQPKPGKDHALLELSGEQSGRQSTGSSNDYNQCPDCNGKGEIWNHSRRLITHHKCQTCEGAGELDPSLTLPQAGWLHKDGTFETNPEYTRAIALRQERDALERLRQRLLAEGVAPAGCWL